MQCILTPAAGKRLIGKAVTQQLLRSAAFEKGTIAVIAGTTNGYVAEELLSHLGQVTSFSRKRFFRGITTAPGIKTTGTGRLPDESSFPGDVVLEKGEWRPGKTIFDCVDNLKQGDIIVKGANCLNPGCAQAGILIGHPKGGTIVAALQAIVGRRVRLILPVGLEKRVTDDIETIARILNAPDGTGPRLLPVTGEIISELEALSILSGVQAKLVAAGGVCGAEGAVWLHLGGESESLQKAQRLLEDVSGEEPFTL